MSFCLSPLMGQECERVLKFLEKSPHNPSLVEGMDILDSVFIDRGQYFTIIEESGYHISTFEDMVKATSKATFVNFKSIAMFDEIGKFRIYSFRAIYRFGISNVNVNVVHLYCLIEGNTIRMILPDGDFNLINKYINDYE